MYKVILFWILLTMNAIAETVFAQTFAPTNSMRSALPMESKYSLDLQMGSVSSPKGGPPDAFSSKSALTISRHFGNWTLSPQLAFWVTRQQGTEVVFIKTNSWEAFIWGRYQFWKNLNFSTYVGLGMGAKKDFISTQIFGQESTLQSEYYTTAGTAVGLHWAPSPQNINPFISMWRLSLEIQYLIIPNYEIQQHAILFGLGVRL